MKPYARGRRSRTARPTCGGRAFDHAEGTAAFRPGKALTEYLHGAAS
ncbi:hypothetical protein AB0A69_04580 [Streptomyces sp. NPDC045431]